MRVDTKSQSDPLRRRLRRLTAGERREEALAFVQRFHRESGLADEACRQRMRAVSASLARTGSYEHTPEELAFGARLAWRHHARCIGRLLWKSLEVIDCRTVTVPEQMAARLVDHLRLATGDGRIRSVISIFAPVRGDTLPAYIESPQLLQYAGYVDDQGRTLGDPHNVENTRIAISLGWRPPATRSPFDLLPVMIREPGGRRLLFELPRSAIREVDIVHPTLPALGELGLRWYAVPCVSSMILTIGGIDYPCAPFNGFYMGTEIASRNFADENRYHLLPRVAASLGAPEIEDTTSLWKDQALLELNRAVLYSFDRAGVTMIDHHTASEQYMEFVTREHAAGRVPSGDWAWIVPPQASSACPVFHLPMRDLNAVPNYYHSRASDGARLRPNHEDETRHRAVVLWDRIKRRVHNWRRVRDGLRQ